jgi:hypothetical protein
MRLGALQSVIGIQVASVSGYSLPPGTRCFQRLGGFPWMLSPAFLRERVHPLVSFASPSECVLFITRPTQVPSDLPGFRSHSRHEHMKPTRHRASHSSTMVRPQRFSRSRRLTPSHTLRACFIPQPRPGFALQGFSPLPSRLASSTSRALMSLAKSFSQQVAPLVPNPSAPPSGR